MPSDMRFAPALSALLISVVLATSVVAQGTFDANTRCGAFLRAVGAEDESAIAAGRSYIMGVMEERDAEHAANGQGDMMGAVCLLYTSPSPRDGLLSRMPSSA